MCAKIDYTWNPSTCTCGNGKYLESITDNSVVTCDENIGTVWSEPTKTMPINFNYKKATYKFYILLALLVLITI